MNKSMFDEVLIACDHIVVNVRVMAVWGTTTP